MKHSVVLLCKMWRHRLGGVDTTIYHSNSTLAAAMRRFLKHHQERRAAVKASGVATYSSEPYPFPRMHPYLREIYDTFGPHRMFWGTDLSRLTYWRSEGAPPKCSYHQAVTLFTQELAWLKGRDLELVMGRALCDWIGWKVLD